MLVFGAPIQTLPLGDALHPKVVRRRQHNSPAGVAGRLEPFHLPVVARPGLFFVPIFSQQSDGEGRIVTC
jgi:hypothetical protein